MIYNTTIDSLVQIRIEKTVKGKCMFTHWNTGSGRRRRRHLQNGLSTCHKSKLLICLFDTCLVDEKQRHLSILFYFISFLQRGELPSNLLNPHTKLRSYTNCKNTFGPQTRPAQYILIKPQLVWGGSQWDLFFLISLGSSLPEL